MVASFDRRAAQIAAALRLLAERIDHDARLGDVRGHRYTLRDAYGRINGMGDFVGRPTRRRGCGPGRASSLPCSPLRPGWPGRGGWHRRCRSRRRDRARC